MIFLKKCSKIVYLLCLRCGENYVDPPARFCDECKSDIRAKVENAILNGINTVDKRYNISCN